MDRGPGQGERLDADAFVLLAAQLERYAEEGLSRVARRVEHADRAFAAARSSSEHWLGEHADTFADAMRQLSERVLGVEPRCGDAYRALTALAPEARRVAEVIREVESYEKSWNQQLVANGSEWLDRITTAGAAMNPWAEAGADHRSAEKTAWYQEQTRRTEEASERRRVALARWDEQCGIVAAKVREATTALNGLMLAPPPALRPPGSYHPDAARDAVRRSWAGLVERVVRDRVGDPSALAAWWAQLDEEERDVLMATSPHLIAGELWDVLSPEEQRWFERSDVYTSRAGSWGIEVEPTILLLRFKAGITVAHTVASDGSVEVTVELGGEAAAGVWAGRLGGGDLGGASRSVITARFGSMREYHLALSLLQMTVTSDINKLGGDWIATRSVLRRHFGGDVLGYEEGGGLVATLAGSFGMIAGFSAESKLISGAYHSGSEGERGLFLQGSAEVLGDAVHREARGAFTFEGKLLLDPDDRRYLRYTYTGEASASDGLLSFLGIDGVEVQGLKLPVGSGSVAVAGEIEITDENAPAVGELLAALATGQVDPALAMRVHDESDVTVTVASGERRFGRPPLNPALGGLVTTSEESTVTALHKTPGGRYYEQGAR